MRKRIYLGQKTAQNVDKKDDCRSAMNVNFINENVINAKKRLFQLTPQIQNTLCIVRNVSGSISVNLTYSYVSKKLSKL